VVTSDVKLQVRVDSGAVVVVVVVVASMQHSTSPLRCRCCCPPTHPQKKKQGMQVLREEWKKMGPFLKVKWS